MDKAVADSVERQFRSAFPAGMFTQVDVLEYGDDPDVEPGEIAVRAFIDRADRPTVTWDDDEKIVQGLADSHQQAIKKLHQGGLRPPVAWIQLIPDTPARRASGAVLFGFPSMFLGMRPDVAEDPAGSATVRVLLGPADLATVDALIAAGTGSSRAEILRWAISRIRENPAQAQM